MFIFRETNIFKTKPPQAEVKKDIGHLRVKEDTNQLEEVEVSSIKGDGFDHVRTKAKLNTHAERLLKE